jgi:hypothetical protein
MTLASPLLRNLIHRLGCRKVHPSGKMVNWLFEVPIAKKKILCEPESEFDKLSVKRTSSLGNIFTHNHNVDSRCVVTINS